MNTLVLSLFPGIDLFGEAFRREGFPVVRGSDVIYGGDIRQDHYPCGLFGGMIGGPPCGAFSPLSFMVRHNGHEPKFGNLTPEFERCVAEGEPDWFIMENVKGAPVPEVPGYGVHSFLLNNRQCIDEDGKPAKQNRVRRISFGVRGDRRILEIDVTLWENPETEYAACGGTHGIGGIGREEMARAHRRKAGRNITLNDCVGFNVKSRESLARLCELQGLPADFLKDSPFTVQGACKAVGNGVPLPMGRAIARAVKEAMRIPLEKAS